MAQKEESSAEELGEEALSLAVDDNEIDWEQNLSHRDDRSLDYLSPPPPYSMYPPSQFSAQSENEEFDPWALAVSEEIAQAFPNAPQFFPQVEPDRKSVATEEVAASMALELAQVISINFEPDRECMSDANEVFAAQAQVALHDMLQAQASASEFDQAQVALTCAHTPLHEIEQAQASASDFDQAQAALTCAHTPLHEIGQVQASASKFPHPSRQAQVALMENRQAQASASTVSHKNMQAQVMSNANLAAQAKPHMGIL